jgi:hypothetical protein
MDPKATRAAVEALSAMDLPFFAIDMSYRYTAFNRAYAERMRNVYRSEVALGKCVLDEPVPAADRARAMEVLARVLDGEQVTVEYYAESPPPPRQYFRVTYIPICASCKKIRDDKGYWSQVEVYIKRHTDADFTHSLCPECIERIYGGFDPEDWKRME